MHTAPLMSIHTLPVHQFVNITPYSHVTHLIHQVPSRPTQLHSTALANICLLGCWPKELGQQVSKGFVRELTSGKQSSYIQALTLPRKVWDSSLLHRCMRLWNLVTEMQELAGSCSKLPNSVQRAICSVTGYTMRLSVVGKLSTMTLYSHCYWIHHEDISGGETEYYGFV